MSSKRSSNMDDSSRNRKKVFLIKLGSLKPNRRKVNLVRCRPVCIIGRSLDSTFIINRPFISRFHCLIKYENNRYFIHDLRSSAGTFVNRKRLPRYSKRGTELHHKDVISFGTGNHIAESHVFFLSVHGPTVYRCQLDCPSEVENYRRTLLNQYALILELKDKLRSFHNEVETDFAEIQTLVHDLMDISNIRTAETMDILQTLKRLSSLVTPNSNDDVKELYATAGTIIQFYILMEEFRHLSLK